MILLIQSGDDEYLMNETRRKPNTGTRYPTRFDGGTGFCNCPVAGWRKETNVGGLTARPKGGGEFLRGGPWWTPSQNIDFFQ